ncbi:MAG: hypothetical protein EOP02_10610 [Proteobacteria bacterium]|nr:MAG: hypothetical protein EOP02_10610 [Pseudomonadota bacterium]
MPRFFFQNCSLTETHLDPDGMELPNLMTALAEPRSAACQIVANELGHDCPVSARWFEIADATGQGVRHCTTA